MTKPYHEYDMGQTNQEAEMNRNLILDFQPQKLRKNKMAKHMI
jgi:hypothetical protein